MGACMWIRSDPIEVPVDAALGGAQQQPGSLVRVLSGWGRCSLRVANQGTAFGGWRAKGWESARLG
jgi:hypothetical protein